MCGGSRAGGRGLKGRGEFEVIQGGAGVGLWLFGGRGDAWVAGAAWGDAGLGAGDGRGTVDLAEVGEGDLGWLAVLCVWISMSMYVYTDTHAYMHPRARVLP